MGKILMKIRTVSVGKGEIFWKYVRKWSVFVGDFQKGLGVLGVEFGNYPGLRG